MNIVVRIEYLDKIYNKIDSSEIDKEYCKKALHEVNVIIGNYLILEFLDGGIVIDEPVISIDEDDYGFWVETENKLFKFDYDKIAYI